MSAVLYSSYAGGMNARAINPSLLGEGQVRMLVNGTVRNGWAAPRPAFHAQELRWLDTRAQGLWENGLCQGAGVLSTPRGDFAFFAFDGRLLRLNLTTLECGQVFPEGADYLKPLFNPRRQFVFFQARAGWMIVQDGTSVPVVANEQSVVAKKMVTGTIMADGWGRLAVVDHARRKIRFSDHELDPNSTPLSFTEGNYFKNAVSFEIPATLGRIMDMQFSPSLNGNDDKGPLLVFCERGIRAYDVSLPRSEWLSRDISATVLPTVGCCAHRAVVARGNDVIFSDHEGRIQSLSAAVSRQQDARVELMDSAVWELYRKEDEALRAHRSALCFDNRVLVSVQPERLRMADGRQRVRHRGLAVLQQEAAAPMSPVWDGLWTGVFPVVMFTASRAGAVRGLILSLDSDGKNRLYELTQTAGPDVSALNRNVSVPMIVSLRPADLGNPFRTKPFLGAALRLGKVRGDAEVKGWWQNADGAMMPWFERKLSHDKDLAFTDQGVRVPGEGSLARLNLPRPTSPDFFEARMSFEITGEASLQEVMLETGEPKSDPNSPTQTGCEALVLTGEATCGPDIWGYDAMKVQT